MSEQCNLILPLGTSRTLEVMRLKPQGNEPIWLWRHRDLELNPDSTNKPESSCYFPMLQMSKQAQRDRMTYPRPHSS